MGKISIQLWINLKADWDLGSWYCNRSGRRETLNLNPRLRNWLRVTSCSSRKRWVTTYAAEKYVNNWLRFRSINWINFICLNSVKILVKNFFCSTSYHRTSTAQGLFKVGPDAGPPPTRVRQNAKLPSVPSEFLQWERFRHQEINNKQWAIKAEVTKSFLLWKNHIN